jgi:glycerol-3-phosphate acyltransferase PlsY
VFAFWAASYVAGSIPVVYLLGRHRRVDLRESGTGTVGGSNLWAAAGMATAALGWIADALKGLLPIAIARRLRLAPGSAEVSGVFGLAGQCWPVFLSFRGGRGISSFVGAAFMIDRLAWTVSIAAMAAGSLARLIGLTSSPSPLAGRARRPTRAARGVPSARLRRSGGGLTSSGLMRDQRLRARLQSERSRLVPLATLAGVLLFPVICAARRRTPLAPPLLLSATVIARRLTAPRLDDADNGPATQPIALWYRLLYDRNTRD